MQEIVTIERNVSIDDVLNDLRRDFPKHPVSLVRFGWIAVDVGVDVTVRLKVRSKRVTVYARRRVAPAPVQMAQPKPDALKPKQHSRLRQLIISDIILNRPQW